MITLSSTLKNRVDCIIRALILRYPLGTSAIIAGAGVLCGHYSGWPIQRWLCFGIVGTLLLWPLSGYRWKFHWLAIFLWVFVGFAVRTTDREAQFASFPWLDRLRVGGERLMRGSGEVLEVLHPGNGKERPAQIIAALDQLEDLATQTKFTGDWRLRLSFPAPSPLPGHKIHWQGRVSYPLPPENPGQFDWPTYFHSLGLSAAVRVDSVVDDGAAPGWLAFFRCWCGTRQIEYLKDLAENVPNPEAGVIQAITLGATDDTPQDVISDFQLSGTLHLFSVSGLHVAMVGGSLWACLRFFGVSKRRAPLILIPMLWLYTGITGSSIPAIRSAMMMSAVLGGLLLSRRSNILNSLGSSAVILLAWRPEQMWGIGFQLSFAAVWALAVFASPLASLFSRWTGSDPFIPRSLLTKWQKRWSKFRHSIVESSTISFAALVGTLPLVLWYFHVITPSSLLANPVAGILSFFMLVLAMLVVGVHSIGLAVLGPWLNRGTYWLSHWLIQSNHFFAGLPGGAVYVDCRMEDWFQTVPAELCVLHLSGGGASVWLRTPGRCHWLFDCGNESSFRRVVLPAMQSFGLNNLDGLFLSHHDINHTGGAKLVTGKWPIQGRFLTTGQKISLCGADGDFPCWLECLYPRPGARHGKADDSACVWVLHLGPWRVLLSSDGGFSTESFLSEHQSSRLAGDVWIKNQHSTDFSGLSAFLHRIAPQVVIVSNAHFPAGERMQQDFPQIVRSTGAVLYDQSVTGAVLLRFFSDRMEIRAWREDVISVYRLRERNPHAP